MSNFVFLSGGDDGKGHYRLEGMTSLDDSPPNTLFDSGQLDGTGETLTVKLRAATQEAKVLYLT